MALDPATAIIDLGSKILDKFIPDPAQRDAAKLELFKAQQSGDLDEIKTQLSAILAEETSPDPWTSRARPSFLYVVYIMILAAIPMGILSAFNPLVATNIAVGFKAWLDAIPGNLYALFGTGYLGYTGFRSWDKKNGVAAK